MASYLEKAKELLGQFDTVTITQIPRNENTNADALARLATGLEDSLLKTVPLEILDELSIDKRQQVDAISDKPTWMDPIIAYLRDGTLPQDKFEARRLRYRSARYFLDKDKLRKRSFSSPSLTCLNEDQAKYVLQEVHEGVCGNHSKLTPVSSPWPFAKWGIDLIGPLPTARGQLKYAVVAIDYYTKWIFSSPAHPKSNGQVEAVNKTIKYTLKKKLEKSKGAWVDELPLVLWSYRTSFRTTTGETPFSLAYGKQNKYSSINEIKCSSMLLQSSKKKKKKSHWILTNPKLRNEILRKSLKEAPKLGGFIDTISNIHLGLISGRFQPLNEGLGIRKTKESLVLSP
ncbi:hypothetical protein UlMin_025490 [Ulmus minor]